MWDFSPGRLKPPALSLLPQYYFYTPKKTALKNAHALIFFFKTCFYSSYTIFITIFTAPSEQNLKQKQNYKKKMFKSCVPHLNLAVNNKEKKNNTMLVTRQTRNNVETIFCNPAIVVIFFLYLHLSQGGRGREGDLGLWRQRRKS